MKLSSAFAAVPPDCQVLACCDITGETFFTEWIQRMQAGKPREINAEKLLKFFESKAGVWIVFMLCGVAWAVWFLTAVMLSSAVYHFPAWFWILLPFGAVIATMLSGFVLMTACVLALSIWINTRGRSNFFRFAMALLALVAVVLMLGFQYVNQD